jgi:MioC protein
MARILLLTGTVTGNADRLSDSIQQRMEAAGYDVVRPEIPDYRHFEEAPDAVLVCTATTGHGDLPEELAFVFGLLDQRPPRAMAGTPYGVLGLGDRSYQDSFCAAAETADSFLEGIGGYRLQPALLINTPDHAGEGLEKPALDWLDGWLELLSRQDEA